MYCSVLVYVADGDDCDSCVVRWGCIVGWGLGELQCACMLSNSAWVIAGIVDCTYSLYTYSKLFCVGICVYVCSVMAQLQVCCEDVRNVFGIIIMR